MIIYIASGSSQVTTTVRRLSFPFPVVCEASGPDAWGTSKRYAGRLRNATKVRVPPLLTFDIGILGNTTVSITPGLTLMWDSATFMFPPADEAGRTVSAAPSRPAAKPVTHHLALAVFQSPATNWSLDQFATTIGMTKQALSRELLKEGESFRQVVRTQRLMRLFFELGEIEQIDDGIAKTFGFAHRQQLEMAIFEQFDITMKHLQTTLHCGCASTN